MNHILIEMEGFLWGSDINVFKRGKIFHKVISSGTRERVAAARQGCGMSEGDRSVSEHS